MNFTHRTIEFSYTVMHDGSNWLDIRIFRKQGMKTYECKPGSPSALRCARLLAKIAESEAKQ